MPKSKRITVNGTLQIVREGQSDYVCELITPNKTYKWYGWSKIPKCFKEVLSGTDNVRYGVSVDLREDGTYPNNVGWSN